MSHENIIRAWKDEKFRNTLSKKEQSLLPANPAGLVELSDEEISDAAGGIRAATEPVMCTLSVCN